MSYVTNDQVYSLSGLTSDDVTSANITSFIGYAEAIVDGKTGYYYNGTADIDEFKNVELKGANKSVLLNGGIPEYMYDYDQRVYRFTLDRLPLNNINSVYITTFNNNFSKVWSLVGATYSDITDDINTEYEDTLFYSLLGQVGTFVILVVSLSLVSFKLDYLLLEQQELYYLLIIMVALGLL